MNIWIINQYASTLKTGFGGRWYYLAKEMAEMGHQVKLFSSANHHLLKNKPELGSKNILEEKIEGFSFIWLKTKDYENAHSKLERLYSEFQFRRILTSLDHKFEDRPDIIIYSSPSLVGYAGASILSKKIGCKIILDIRDLWPLTLIEMGISKYHPFIMYLAMLEKKAYLECDHIISNWPYAINYIKKYGVLENKFDWIPNGFSMSEFSDPIKLDKKIENLIPSDKFIIGYAGTLGHANALKSFIEAGSLLKENKDIVLMIVGSGKEKQDLVDYADKLGCSNVLFLDSVTKKQVPSLLRNFSACYVGFLDINLYKYGSSLTKLPEYLASGKPIIYASSSTFQPIEQYKAGITIPAEKPDLISKAILELYKLDNTSRKAMGDNGRDAAVSNYDYKKLATKLIGIINQIG
ncbi:glycosyltransferase family 4 protein [Acinetobacter sp. YH12085]|uniref:glycosyltransferase family 4 protein n=1 Tax=Acinetobacter sp. YH12085 TaxID=2601077 RepID=UPI0015D10C7B|nr:glycosyltransferase family 4 protein [Acinetobacter sp. YH12085]